MKNTNNKSLNDLFRAARDEASTELLSDREAEQLLVNGTMRSLPTKQTIGQQLYGLLFSTPLKIGITTMTTATCIALGVFAFWPQTSVTNNSLASISQGTKTTYGTYGMNKSTETAIVAAPKSLPQTIIDKAPVFHSADALPPAPIATADSLHPFELSPEQLAQLGIVLEDNGDIDFYTKSTAGEVYKYDLPPSWGMRLHLGEKFSAADIAGLTMPIYAPRLVTEPNGAKRLFSFESDTSFTNNDGGNKVMVKMHNSLNISPNTLDSSPHVLINRTITKTIENSNTTTNAKTNSNTSDSLHANEDQRVYIKIVGDSSNSKGTKFDLSLDSILESKPGSIKFHGNRLIISDEGSDALSSLESASNALRRADSILAQSELNSESDTSARMKLHTAEAEYEMAVKALQNKANSFAKNYIQTSDSADRADFAAKELAVSNSINLDHLIPIRIRNTKNPEHPNELIFWYEPTPEVTAAIPDASVSQQAPQSKQLAISVYPNPTNGPAQIHFDLANTPKAHFSIRNLLGQQVLDGGSTSGASGDMKLDLSSLDAGVYLLVTTTDDGERDVERVVVAK